MLNSEYFVAFCIWTLKLILRLSIINLYYLKPKYVISYLWIQKV